MLEHSRRDEKGSFYIFIVTTEWSVLLLQGDLIEQRRERTRISFIVRTLYLLSVSFKLQRQSRVPVELVEMLFLRIHDMRDRERQEVGNGE